MPTRALPSSSTVSELTDYVSIGTVTSQLLYEIGGPRYLGPDVTARFDTIRLEQVAVDRVSIHGARGEPPPATLKVAIKPTEDRESGVIAVEVGSSLAANRPLATTLYMGRRDGRLVAVTVDPRQNDMFADSGDVLPLKGKEGVA